MSVENTYFSFSGCLFVLLDSSLLSVVSFPVNCILLRRLEGSEGSLRVIFFYGKHQWSDLLKLSYMNSDFRFNIVSYI